jgi:hypothetical protein
VKNAIKISIRGFFETIKLSHRFLFIPNHHDLFQVTNTSTLSSLSQVNFHELTEQTIESNQPHFLDSLNFVSFHSDCFDWNLHAKDCCFELVVHLGSVVFCMVNCQFSIDCIHPISLHMDSVRTKLETHRDWALNSILKFVLHGLWSCWNDCKYRLQLEHFNVWCLGKC